MYWDFEAMILGEPASSKNQRRIVFVKGKPRLIKSQKALDYARDFDLQCPTLPDLLEGPLALRIDVWFRSRRPDLAVIDLIQDLLQMKVYKNDRQVKASMSIWNLDPSNPRTLVRVRRVTADDSTGLSCCKHSEIWGSDQNEIEQKL